jgi:UDP-N-acetylglucosamine 4,6-dehydratase
MRWAQDMTSFLITGGTGTFGNAAASMLLRHPTVQRVVIFSRDEQKQDEMARRFNDERLRFFVGDVRDFHRLKMALRGVEVVFHAAAMKIVPKCEYDPIEAIKTNILGSSNLIEASIESDVEQVIAISTDKAASSANLYGATKQVAEKAFIAANNLSGAGGAIFSVVRYGNVSGSRGSVIPLWTRLAADGRPLPITSLAMTRFWIDIEDAVTFVLKALEIQRGGEIFIPKMPSFRISDLAEAIYGRADFPSEIIGLRPGEKVHEDLITEHEGRMATENQNAYVICPPWLPPSDPLEDGFHLKSSENKSWLTIDDMKNLICGDCEHEKN